MGKMARTVVTLAAILVALLLLLMIVTNPLVGELVEGLFDRATGKTMPTEAIYSFERIVTVDPEDGTIIDLTIDLPIPIDLQGQQHLELFQSSVSYDDSSRYGLPWAEWSGAWPDDADTVQIVITYQIDISTMRWDIDADESGSVDDLPTWAHTFMGRHWYLNGHWMIDPLDPNISSLAAEIVGDEDDVATILELIYDWTVENIDYPDILTTEEPKSARQTLISGEGDCDEQAMLYISLARAAGVPAWLQVGILYDSSRDVFGNHGWVQTYVPTDEGGENVTVDTVNHRFMVHGSDIIIEYTDDGDAEHLEDYYYYFQCSVETGSYGPNEGPSFVQEFNTLEYWHSDDYV